MKGEDESSHGGDSNLNSAELATEYRSIYTKEREYLRSEGS